MKKKFLQIIITIILMAIVFPIPANAFGGYFVIKGTKKYHNVLCDSLNGYYIEDVTWYKTLKEVKKAKLSPASCCQDEGIDYEDDESSIWNSENPKLDNALEIERLYGVIDGYESGKADGYNEGYDEGYLEGITIGKETGYEEAYQKGKMDAEAEAAAILKNELKKNTNETILSTLGVTFFLVLPILSIFLDSFFPPKKKAKSDYSASKNKIANNQNDANYVLGLICKRSGMTPTVLAESLYVNYLKSQGYSDESARKELQKEKQNFPNNK